MLKNISTRFLLILVLLLINPVFADNNYRGNVILESEFADYMTNLKNKIHDNWTAPSTLENGHVSVIFRVNRIGEIISAEIQESSGDDIFDSSALEALNKSVPFGNFPSGSTRNSLTIQYHFDTTLVSTDKLKEYALKADKLYNIDNNKALEYINLAIKEADDDCLSYFLYARRSKIQKALGNNEESIKDSEKSKELKKIYNLKKIESCKQIAEKDNTAYSYFILAHAYDSACEYDKALSAIDKAIQLTPLNNGYKRYKNDIIQRKDTN